MNTPQNTTINIPVRQTAVNSLAVIGFIALIIVGMSLAVYSTRFVPTVVSRVGSAAVYLGSVFNPAPEPTLSVVPTTISFGTASSTVSTSTSTSTTITTNVVTTPKPVGTTAGPSTSGTYQIGSGPAAVTPYGLPDLTVYISAIGYLTTDSADSFVMTQTVPSGSRPAAKFTIKNIGTNWTGTWRFSASIPTLRAYTFESQPQQSLAPGESIDYTLGFDQANSGSDQMISITANFDLVTAESDKNNNTITAFFTIL